MFFMEKMHFKIFFFSAALIAGVLGFSFWGSDYFVFHSQADQKPVMDVKTSDVKTRDVKIVLVEDVPIDQQNSGQSSRDLPLQLPPLDLSKDKQFFDYPPVLQTVADDEPIVLAEETSQSADVQEEHSKDVRVKHTVAVVVMPRQQDGSSWDVGAGADIVLCGAAGCYVSNGLEKPATFYEGGAGLRLLKKAGACRDRLSCVFRDMDLTKLTTETNKIIEPVDVDYVSHSYMGGAPFKTGPQGNKVPAFLDFDNCSLKRAVIDCKVGVHERNYSLWAMPEKLAETGGREALDAVLFKGLLFQRADFTAKNLLEQREQVRKAVFNFYSKMFAQSTDVSLSGLKHCLANDHFITETFFVLGLADATERKAEGLILDLVGQLPDEKVRSFIQRTPQFYWAFLDLVAQLKAFSSAETYTLDQEREGILLKASDIEKSEQVSSELEKAQNSNELLYGWQVKARAKAALLLCENTK